MFTINGKEYASKTAAGIALMAEGKSCKEASAMVGIAYQTLYVNTTGKEKRQRQLAKLRAKRLISSKRKYSKAEIGRRTGLGDKLIRKMFSVVAGNAPVAPVAPVAETPAPVAPVAPVTENPAVSA